MSTDWLEGLVGRAHHSQASKKSIMMLSTSSSSDCNNFNSHHRRRRKRRRRSVSSIIIASAVALLPINTVNAHGYFSSPRSRNYVAYQDSQWVLDDATSTEDTKTKSAAIPYPEPCPHCLNRGGSLAQCGLVSGIDNEGEAWIRNYDTPMNYNMEPMSSNVQATYVEGDIIDVEVLITTHHKGHFVFSACPISKDMEVPTAECFEKYKLTFVLDELYGANRDPNYPERVYLAPAGKIEWTHTGFDVKDQPVTGAPLKYKLQLPRGLIGDVVLLQWYYLTANSCKHEGYDRYQWPVSWGSDPKLYNTMEDCGEVPEDGNGVPEQFWNCAEVRINPKIVEQTEELTPFVQCADTSYSYYEATQDCTGYVYCMAGGDIDGPYDCGVDMLYDTDTQRCMWADQVTSCSGGSGGGGGAESSSPGVPTLMPTPKPTQKNALLDWEKIPRHHDKVIIGYYASWQWYDRCELAAPINMDFSKITRANFAFFQITEEGDIYGTDSWADPITLFGPYDWKAETGFQYCSWDEPGIPPECGFHNYEEGLLYLAHKAGAEVYPSIGGWSLSDPFPPMAANPVARKHFAKQCVELIKNYNFDGIDLDWEYPGYAPHSGTPDDTINFNLLLDDVRAALDELGEETGKFYGLTAALPCGPSLIDNQDVAHVSSVLTELNLMTYDFHGSWNPTTGVNAPLYDQHDSPDLSVHGCVKNWEAGGAPREKMNIGFPFYGRSFVATTGLYEPHDGSDEGTWHADEGIPQFYNIQEQLSTMEQWRDEQTKTQIAYYTKDYSDKGNLVSFDDQQAICDKTEYAIDNGLLGYIIWELSGDIMEDRSTPLLDAANAKLYDPGLPCTAFAQGEVIVFQSTAGDAAETPKEYYPYYDTSICISDGLTPSWLQPNVIFDSLSDCCTNNFPWNVDECVTGSMPNKYPYYAAPAAYHCLNNGKQPAYVAEDQLFDSAKECCEYFFGWVDIDVCVADSGATSLDTDPTPITTTTTKATAATTTKATSTFTTTKATTSSITAMSSPLFFPVFESGTTACHNEGDSPSWLSIDDFKETSSECCYSYAYDYDDCMNASAVTRARYYPDYEMMACLSDKEGTPPDWMTDDYLRWTEKRCCSTFFSTAESSPCSDIL